MYDIAVLGGDIRQVYMVSLFHEANLSVITYGLTHPMIEDNCTQGTSIKETIKSSMVLVSAIPFSRDGITIPSLTAASDMNVTQFTSHTCCNQTLFAGMLSPSIKSFCQQNDINYYDFMEDDAVAIANGIAIESRSPTRLFCGSPLCGVKPILEPIAAPSRIPHTDDDPPKWQFTILKCLSRFILPLLTYKSFALSDACISPQSSATRSAANLWLAPWKPFLRIPIESHFCGTA